MPDKNPTRLKKRLIFGLIILTSFIHVTSYAQAPHPALIGYFQNWRDGNCPYIQMHRVDPRYNIINVSFAVPKLGTDYNMNFVPDQVTQANFIAQIKERQEAGKTVIISIGGATAPVSLDNDKERDQFISSMGDIIDTYGFEGIDIDLEGKSLAVTKGSTIAEPVDVPVINMIYAIRQIMKNYYIKNGRHLLLTMAPETAFVQGGQSKYEGIWGAYLPLIDALRDSIDILHVQLYNSGSMYGIDRKIYNQGTADFLVAMSEAVIKGFNTAGGHFNGLPSSKIAVALPACSKAASGYTKPEDVEAAINYIMGKGSKPGNYILSTKEGYPDFRGMMTWSINWDAVSTCGEVYEYASTFERIFGSQVSAPLISATETNFTIYPNPSSGTVRFQIAEPLKTPENVFIYNSMGQLLGSKIISEENLSIDISNLPAGLYYLNIGHQVKEVIKL